MSLLWLVSLVGITSFLLTGLLRKYAIAKNIMDEPNERSSHSISTPRGGGLAIVITFLTGMAVLWLTSFLDDRTFIALFGSGFLVAAIGLIDDYGHIAARWRLLFHFVAAFWVLYFIGIISEFQILNYSINAAWFSAGITALFLVWMLNLFNFMDGIDGIAASEIIFVACAGAYFSWLNDLENLSYISLIFASSTMGFLILNWPPAKIFMGDVGSGFLGLILGIIAYANIIEGGSLWIWLILLAVFLVDSGVTLLKRIINGDKWYEAHCSHAYQHAARKWGHKRVTVATIIINLCWLLPLAYLVYLYEDLALMLMCVAYIPLIILALKFKSGMADNS